MSYNPNIPLVGDFMVVSQPQILSNFQEIFSVFSRNHVPLNSAVPGNLQGMHSALTLRAQTTDPTTTSSQLALYVKTVTGVTSLFFRPSSNQTPIQLTYPSISTGLQSTNPDVYLSRQYSFLAAPFVFYFGEAMIVDGTVITLTPTTTLLYVGLISNIGGGSRNTSAAATNINVGGTKFTVRIPAFPTAGPFNVFYMAIGQ